MMLRRLHKTVSLHRMAVVAALLLATLLSAPGCSTVTESSDLHASNSAQPADPSSGGAKQQNKEANHMVDKRLVSANTDFGFKLYQQVLKQSAGENLFISPASVGLALAMTYNGAEGSTKQAMARALSLQGMSMEEVNRAYSELRAALASADPKVQLSIANSLWARKGMAFRPEFIKRNQEAYAAEIAELNFSDPSAQSTINNWVSSKTNGKIEKIVDQISQDSILFLINAIYFKGKWQKEFEKDKTKEETFHLPGGAQKKHPMMAQSGSYNYYKGANFQAVSLPYGEGRLSMYVFLPDSGTSLEQFHKSLNAANWESWMEEFADAKGDIVLPRFKLEYGTELGDALKALGMEVAFNPEAANFSAMIQSSQNAFISQVKHKTFVEVNEEGTEAAAATSVEVQITSMRQPQERFRMVVDRPFFCAIRDNQTGTILFMGSITDPK